MFVCLRGLDASDRKTGVTVLLTDSVLLCPFPRFHRRRRRRRRSRRMHHLTWN